MEAVDIISTNIASTSTSDQDGLTEPLLSAAAKTDVSSTVTTTRPSSSINDTDDSDNDYVLLSSDNYPLDPKRFWVLMVFSLNNLLAAAEWITFAPIEDAVQVRYGGISAKQVNWLSMIFMAAYGPGTAVAAWSIRRWGLRTTVVVASVLMAVGSFLRWWSVYLVRSSRTDSTESTSNGLAYTVLLLGQGVVAIGQPVFSNAPARVAAAWFRQTTQAIAVAVFAAMIGMVLGQAMSPLLVEEATGAHLDQLLALQAISMALCAVATWWFFESEPAAPPSAAEAARRRQPPDTSSASVGKDVWTLITDPQYIILIIAFGVGYGVNNAVLTLLQPWIAAAGFPGDETAGLCGTLAITGGVVGTLIAAPLLDNSQNYNQAVRWSFPVAFLVAVALVATLQPARPVWLLATAFMAMGMSQLPLLTICLDAAAAHSYPIPEELSSAGLQLVGQYLGIFFIDGMGTFLDSDHPGSGFTAPVNILFLVLLGVSAAVAMCYNGDDPRATANQAAASANTTTDSDNGVADADADADADAATWDEEIPDKVQF